MSELSFGLSMKRCVQSQDDLRVQPITPARHLSVLRFTAERWRRPSDCRGFMVSDAFGACVPKHSDLWGLETTFHINETQQHAYEHECHTDVPADMQWYLKNPEPCLCAALMTMADLRLGSSVAPAEGNTLDTNTARS